MSLLAASTRPAAVRTLTVIEPPALGLARGNASVEIFISRMTKAYSSSKHASLEEFYRAFLDAFGYENPPRVAYSVLGRGLKAERAVFDEAAHNPQNLGKPFNDRLRRFLETSPKH